MNLKIKKNRKYKLFFVLFLLFVILSCKKEKDYEANVSYQYLICDEPTDKIKIKYVESFFVIKNKTNDTLKIPVKLLSEEYVHVFNRDTLLIHFEKFDSIFVSPKDSIGLACMSYVNKVYDQENPIFHKGFNIYNINDKQSVKKRLGSPVQKREDFQIYR